MPGIRWHSGGSSAGRSCRGENILYMSPDAADDSYGDALFMHLYQEAGYKPNILFRSADTESILMMVAAEEGISILPDYCTDKLYNADNLAFVPLVGAGRRGGDHRCVAKRQRQPGAGTFPHSAGRRPAIK